MAVFRGFIFWYIEMYIGEVDFFSFSVKKTMSSGKNKLKTKGC